MFLGFHFCIIKWGLKYLFQKVVELLKMSSTLRIGFLIARQESNLSLMEKGMSSYPRTCLLSFIVSFSASQIGPSITVTCTEGKWNKQVACEPVDCGVPDHHHVYAASFSCPEGTTFGRRCSFQCRHPAQLKGILISLSQSGLHQLWKA